MTFFKLQKLSFIFSGYIISFSNFLFSRGKRIKSILHNRWIVLTCACAVLMIGGGFFLSFGVLFVDLLEEFGESRAQTATVQLIHFAVVNLASEYHIITQRCHWNMQRFLKAVKIIIFCLKILIFFLFLLKT